MAFGTIEVANLSRARRHKRRFGAVVTIEDPGFRNGLRFHRGPQPEHLVLRFEDVDEPENNVWAATLEDIVAGLEFCRTKQAKDQPHTTEYLSF